MTTRILYNGSCPICSREILAYMRYTKKKNLNIFFDDISHSDLTEWGIQHETALKRIHVMHNGEIFSGIPAFALIWGQMPHMRWLAWGVRLPIIRRGVGALYDYVLAPILYHLHVRRQKNKCPSCNR